MFDSECSMLYNFSWIEITRFFDRFSIYLLVSRQLFIPFVDLVGGVIACNVTRAAIAYNHSRVAVTSLTSTMTMFFLL